jgi:PEP-CTERM motif
VGRVQLPDRIPAAVPLNFIADYAQWQGPTGANIPQTGFIFGQTLMANPVPGMTGSGEGSSGFVNPVGSGPLGSLGAFADPFNRVLSGLPAAQVNGFTQALEFAPETAAVPEPSTWAMMLAGFAGLSWLAHAHRRKTSPA